MNDFHTLAKIPSKLNQGKVLVIGDVMLDRFVYGEVSRVSPEAPVPVIHANRTEQMLGGAGNVARNLAALGCDVHLLSVIGNDEVGSQIQTLLNHSNIKHTLVETERCTSVKTRYVGNDQQQLMRLDIEDASELNTLTNEELVDKFTNEVKNYDVVILSDYNKGVLSPTICRELISLANSSHKRVVVDPKGYDYTKYSHAYLIKPNKNEFLTATNQTPNIEASAKEMVLELGISNVLVTLGPDGMMLINETESKHFSTTKRTVYDVSGAGDTSLAVIAACLAINEPLESAVPMANIASGLVVQKAGTATILPSEIVAEFHELETSFNIIDWETAGHRVTAWKQNGLVVGFTNGCFDLIHPGHTTSLAKIKDRCDKLIVGINSDKSVRRLKGNTRPIQDETARAQVLASLASVDVVVIFDEDTPLELIKHLKPNKLFKGADYALEDVVGGKEVIASGGVVELIELEQGHSTTSIVQKIKETLKDDI